MGKACVFLVLRGIRDDSVRKERSNVKYDIEQSVQEVKRRSKERVKKAERRVRNGITAAVLIFVIAFAFVMYQIGGSRIASPDASSYGAFLLSREAGGYILVGVICFAAAVAITLLCLKLKSIKNLKKKDEQK